MSRINNICVSEKWTNWRMKEIMWVNFIIYNFQISEFMTGSVTSVGAETL